MTDLTKEKRAELRANAIWYKTHARHDMFVLQADDLLSLIDELDAKDAELAIAWEDEASATRAPSADTFTELNRNLSVARDAYLKALETVELMAGILASDAGADKRNVHQFYAEAVRKLREGVAPDERAPSAELEALLEDAATVIAHIRTSADEEALAAAKRLEAALRGKL